MKLSEAQRAILLQPIKPYRVKTDNQGMSYLEGYEVIAHLNRLFGFEGWDKEVTSLTKVFDDGVMDEKRNRMGWSACFTCTVRLTVHGVTVKEDVGVGSSPNLPSHADAIDLAAKTAVTDGLKRCTKDLGDQFGLSLYDKGSKEALVNRVIPYESPEPEKAIQ